MSDWGSDSTQNRLDLEELVAANNESNKTMLALIGTVREETAARDRKIVALDKQQSSIGWAIGLVCVGILILICVAIINATNIANTRRQTADLAHVADEVDRTNKTLLDCINSSGACGRANSAVQNDLLDEVKKYELIGFYCIRNNPATEDPNAEKFLTCMDRLYPGGPKLEQR